MPDLSTAPDGVPVAPSDKIALLRGGQLYSVTIGELAATFQPALTLTAGQLLGRDSNAPGVPQALAVGAGLSVAGEQLIANGEDHLGLNLLPWLDNQAELIVNSAGRPSRLPLSMLRGAFPFSAGAGVSIDANGVISIAVTVPADAWLDENHLPVTDQNGQPILG